MEIANHARSTVTVSAADTANVMVGWFVCCFAISRLISLVFCDRQVDLFGVLWWVGWFVWSLATFILLIEASVNDNFYGICIVKWIFMLGCNDFSGRDSNVNCFFVITVHCRQGRSTAFFLLKSWRTCRLYEFFLVFSSMSMIKPTLFTRAEETAYWKKPANSDDFCVYELFI